MLLRSRCLILLLEGKVTVLIRLLPKKFGQLSQDMVLEILGAKDKECKQYSTFLRHENGVQVLFIMLLPIKST